MDVLVAFPSGDDVVTGAEFRLEDVHGDLNVFALAVLLGLVRLFFLLHFLFLHQLYY